MTSTSDRPAVVRRIDTQDAQDLAALAALFDDMQMVLRCCERLVAEIAGAAPDDVVLEGVWTTAVLSYTRCFSGKDTVRLIDDDVKAVPLKGDLLGWHEILGKLRDHYAHPTLTPREQFAVGAALDDDGKVSGIAITSTPRPPLDDVTVRQTGALAYELSKLIDKRITERQRQVHETVAALSSADLGKLPLIDLA